MKHLNQVRRECVDVEGVRVYMRLEASLMRPIACSETLFESIPKYMLP